MLAEGGSIPDPAKNAPLKKAIEKAAKQNVPRQTIQNALQRLAANNGETKRHVFEGRLFGKVTALICINTDHMQLAKNLVANAFKKVRSVKIVYPIARTLAGMVLPNARRSHGIQNNSYIQIEL